ncbi:DNA polymerase delta catalytic subunit, partial [Bonamia ostreae]
YTTLVSKKQALTKLNKDDYVVTPNGDYFVTPKLQQGLLPQILRDLLQQRKKAKRDLRNAKDPFAKGVLNGRQMALKISANSVYGFTGASSGSLPCIAISSSVTAYGREMILQTKRKVESEFTAANGYKHDAKVIYGDTDSVMVKFGAKSVPAAMELGKMAAETVTKLFKNPISLEFEKVYQPYLLMAKKRYAGMLWTDPDKPSHMDAKGIETVRRDNCALARDLVQKCLDKLLIEQDVEAALEFAKRVIKKLLVNKVDLSKLVISKSLGKAADSSGYKVKLPHVELAKRMAKRDSGSAPMVGDRVAYVIVQGQKGARQYEKAEDPIYVLEKGLPIDTAHYLEHQLKMPLERIFSPIIGNVNQLLCFCFCVDF